VTSARDWVEQLCHPQRRYDATVALVGGVTATELRGAKPSEEAIVALLGGTRHPDPKVRWWSVQLLDHLPDARAIGAFAELLDDPVPRVRRNAVHALGCAACKPGWDGHVDEPTVAKLASLATDDPSEKVRKEALRALACRT
jgi:HEAT repeat protein